MKKEKLRVIEGTRIESLWVRKDLNGENTLQVGWQEMHHWGMVNWDFNFGEGGVLGVGRTIKNATSKDEKNLIFEVVGTGLKVKLEYSSTNESSRLSVANLQLYKEQLEAREGELVELGVSINPIKAIVKKLGEMIEKRSRKNEEKSNHWEESGIQSAADVYRN